MTDAGTKQVEIISPMLLSRAFDATIISPIDPLPPFTKTIFGTIKDRMKVPVQRKAYAFRRSTGQLIGEVLSDPTTGQYQFDVPNEEIIVVVLDDNDSPLLNDLINRVLPE